MGRGLSRGGGFGAGGLGGALNLLALPFLESSNSRSSKLEANLLATDEDGLLLKIWLPDFAGLLLRKRYVITELLSLACDVACV
jgi:hypothetical protein